MPDATIKQVGDFFGMSTKELREEWSALTDDDKAQLKAGVGDGSLTY